MNQDNRRYKAKRRVIFKIADSILHLFDRVGGRKLVLHPDKMIEKACKQTGLDDFGDDSFREPLEILCRHTREGKPMTFLGRVILGQDLMNRLKNKLKIQAEIKAHPEILEQEVPRPIIINGLPRTGSTLLQRLLAEDPMSRTLRSWEMIDPLPVPEPATFETDPRIKTDIMRWNIYNWAVPHRMMHDTHPTFPEECFSMMANDLISTWFFVGVDCMEFLEWLLAQDHTLTYQLHKRQLQLLQWKFPTGVHWVLKAHWHFFGLEWLLKAYPDARIVYTHRNLSHAVPSNASLIMAVRSQFYEEVDPVAISDAYLHLFSHYFGRGLEARDAEENRADSQAIFYDVFYKDFIPDPLGTAQKMYERFNLEMTPEILGRMKKYLEEQPQHKHGKHKYDLQQFGLDEQKLLDRFGDYYRRFGL